MLTYEQKMAVNKRVKECVELGREKLGADLDMPLVRFDKRGTTAGTANSRHNYVNFNAGLLVDNWERFMEDTIPHEVAHLIKDNLYGRGTGVNSPHGFYWQQVMLALGVEPTRTHNMDVKKVAMPKTKHVYRCPGCKAEMIITQVRHNRIQRGAKRYMHNCLYRSDIEYVRTLGKVMWSEARKHKENGTSNENRAPRKTAEPKAGTKIAHAIVIYKAMHEDGNTPKRKDIIAAMAHSMQVSDAAAVNYYQQCKRRLG